MVNIRTDTDKLNVICDFVNHPNFPYGTTTLTFKINGLMMDATNELILFNNSQGGFVFASFVNDLYFNNVKATMQTVNSLFQETCFSCCSSGGGGGGGDIHIDGTEIVKALNNINKTLRYNCGDGGICDYKETYLTLEQYNALSAQSPNIKYIIYCESGDCTYDEEDFDTNLDPSEEVCEENIDFNEKYMTIDEYNQSDKDGEIRYNIIET